MTVSALIRRAAEAGVEMSVGQGGRLLLSAEHQPPVVCQRLAQTGKRALAHPAAQ